MEVLIIADFIDDGFPFALNEPKRQPDYPIHRHDFTELVFVHKGHGVNIVNGHEHLIHDGDVFVIEKGVEHEYCRTSELYISSLLLDLDSLPLPLELLGRHPGYYSLFEVEPGLRKKYSFKARLNMSSETMTVVDELLGQLRVEWHDRKPGYEAAIIGFLTELMVLLARCYVEQSLGGDSQAVSRVGEVVSRIETGFKSDISLDELVSIACMSKRSLIRYFNSVYNMPPIKYLLQVRIRKASEMLRGTNKSISAIAMECGFDDSNYFTRQFRRAIGMSPREYRGIFISTKGKTTA
ncbi:MAG: helix-turn-helix domain-containing protein [Victivallales bacterium]|nr:helix-turn-helix domain-containing protein [Victivallales bacterium]